MKKLMMLLALVMTPTLVQAKDLGVMSDYTVTDRSILRAGDYFWNDRPSLPGTLWVQVNLSTQMAYVMRGRTMIAATNISSGRLGYETPTGVFTILGKEDDHWSTKYKASMRWTMWVNNDGVALHSGGTPGHPSSHGCMHLPDAFAEQLYKVIKRGAVVNITDDTSSDNLVLDLNS